MTDSALKNIIIFFITTLILAFAFIPLSTLPAEDAAMIFRYAENLANGHGLVWNIGEKPVDGATDFLYTLILSSFSYLGFQLENSSILLNTFSHLLTTWLVFILSYTVAKRSLIFSIFIASFIFIGSAMAYIEAMFGTTFFALLCALSWFFSFQYYSKNKNIDAILFGLFSLLTGLTRPEGVFLTLFILIAIIGAQGLKKSRMAVYSYVFFVFTLGGAYFLWRWNYFGHPLPNPFYKKGGGELYFGSLLKSLEGIWLNAYPYLTIILAYSLIIFSSKTLFSQNKKKAFYLLFPPLAFSCLWLLLSNEMNYHFRFQYPIIPIIAMVSAVLYDKKFSVVIKSFFSDKITTIKKPLVIYSIIIFTCIIIYQARSSIMLPSASKYTRHKGHFQLAQLLKEYQDNNYTIALTEAGIIPYYSKWKSIDAWGLNDQWIAHNQQITPEYLDKYKPEIIMFHAYFSPKTILRARTEEEWDQRWFAMVKILKKYAEERNYSLVAVFGDSPIDTYYYYVKSGFKDSVKIATEISSLTYGSKNYRNLIK